MSLTLILLAGGAVLTGVVSLILAARAHVMTRDATARLDELEDEVRHLRRRISQADESTYVTNAVLMDRGVLNPGELADARERLVERPRRARAEQEELLRDVQDRERLAERMVTPPVERKH
ncbi:MAG: hypothetical protein AB2A00_37825 [Myxococcota bacterium]